MDMHIKSTLRNVLKTWRGREFTGDELKGFDLKDVLGTPCLLQITHYSTAEGMKRAMVSSVSKLPKAMAALDGEKKKVFFDCEESDLSILEDIPSYFVERIKESNTYKNRISIENAGEIEDLDDEEQLPF